MATKTAKGLAPLAGLLQLERLEVTSGVRSLAPLRNLVEMQVLAVDASTRPRWCTRSDCGCFIVENVHALAALEQLQALTLSSTHATDLTPLGTLINLKKLDVSNNPELRDGAFLARMTALEELNVGQTGIRDLTACARLAHLRRVVIDDASARNELVRGSGRSFEDQWAYGLL